MLLLCDEKNFNKKLVITKNEDEVFKNSTKCWICDNFHVNGDVKVRDHRNYRSSTRADCNTKS